MKRLSRIAAGLLVISLVTGCAYGLRSGWVTLPVVGKGLPKVGVFEDWIEESYRAVAPKKLVAELDRRADGQR